MYQFSYAEIMEDDVADARDRERHSQDAVEALYFTRRLWIRFVEDLGAAENQLDPELRANLISIAIWILKETEKIRNRQSDNFQAIIDITTIIRDGLK